MAVDEHLLAPHAIAAPLHRHTKEDEFSLVLEGRVWFIAPYGCEGDFRATVPIIEKYGLTYG